MNKIGKDIADFVASGDLTVATTTYTDNGVEIVKTSSAKNASDENAIYYSDYRLYGEEVAYSDSTK